MFLIQDESKDTVISPKIGPAQETALTTADAAPASKTGSAQTKKNIGGPFADERNRPPKRKAGFGGGPAEVAEDTAANVGAPRMPRPMPTRSKSLNEASLPVSLEDVPEFDLDGDVTPPGGSGPKRARTFDDDILTAREFRDVGSRGAAASFEPMTVMKMLRSASTRVALSEHAKRTSDRQLAGLLDKLSSEGGVADIPADDLQTLSDALQRLKT